MGSAARRQREREQMRRLILEAAREEFVRHGYENTTMRAIAQRIEYTPTALYHYFESKEAMLSGLAAQDFRSLGAAFEHIGRVEDPVERLVRTALAYVDFGLEHPMHYRFMFMTPGLPGRDESVQLERDDPTGNAYVFLRETCDEAIAAGRFRPELEDAEQVAQMLWGAMHGLLALHIVNCDDPWIEWADVRATARRACEALIRGIVRESSA